MLVIADTTPLNYLILIEAIELLPRLYPQVILPRGAWLELQQPGAPPTVAVWARTLPPWIEVREAPVSTDPALAALGAGEREAITLAELHRPASAVLLLLDELAARQLPFYRGLPATGTLGILTTAADAGWIDLPTVFGRLRQTNFRASAALLETLLAEDAARKNKPE
jgi:predicted nucleic acid-binding protein